MGQEENKKIKRKLYILLAFGCLTFVFWIVLYFIIPDGHFNVMNNIEKVAIVGSLVYGVLWLILLFIFVSRNKFKAYEKSYWINRSKQNQYRERKSNILNFISRKFLIISGSLGLLGWVLFLLLLPDSNNEIDLISKIILLALLAYTLIYFILVFVRMAIIHTKNIEDHYTKIDIHNESV